VEEAEAERQRWRRQKEIKHNGVEGKVVEEEVVGRRCGGCHFSMHTELLTIWRLASPYFVAGHAPSSQPPNPQKNLLRLWPPSLAFGLISELGEIGGLGSLGGLGEPGARVFAAGPAVGCPEFMAHFRPIMHLYTG